MVPPTTFADAAADAGAASLAAGPSSPAVDIVHHDRRVVPFEALHNFRDLGGYRTTGGTIGWGRLFRADGLQRATEGDLDLIDGLGIRTVIDLRSSPELAERGRFPVERYPVSFHHLPVLDTTWDGLDIPDFDETEAGTVGFLTWAYCEMLRDGAPRFAEAIRVLALPGALPAVFHCAAGKDRTGMLAMLVLGGLGVDHEVIAEDYRITESGMERMRAWVREFHPEMLQHMGETPAFMLAAHPQAVRNVLGELQGSYGSVRGYLASIGIGSALMADLAGALVD